MTDDALSALAGALAQELHDYYQGRQHKPPLAYFRERIESALSQQAEEIEQLKANEALALCRLSEALTGGNAGTWEQVFDSVASLRAELEQARATPRKRFADLRAQMPPESQARIRARTDELLAALPPTCVYCGQPVEGVDPERVAAHTACVDKSAAYRPAEQGERIKELEAEKESLRLEIQATESSRLRGNEHLLAERDRLRGELGAAEQHVRILHDSRDEQREKSEAEVASLRAELEQAQKDYDLCDRENDRYQAELPKWVDRAEQAERALEQARADRQELIDTLADRASFLGAHVFADEIRRLRENGSPHTDPPQVEHSVERARQATREQVENYGGDR